MSTPIDLSQAWVPVPLRWRHVIPGDVFVGRDNILWTVTEALDPQSFSFEVVVSRIDDHFRDNVDPDDVINVLVPVTERDAVELTMEELGARLVQRRTEG